MERLIRQEKLAAVGQISGSIAHELRNPLSAIKQSIFFLNRLLEKNELESSGAKVKKHFELLTREIDESNKVISDLLQMSKMDSLEKNHTNLRSVISEVLDRFPIENHGGTITLASKIGKGTTVSIELPNDGMMEQLTMDD